MKSYFEIGITLFGLHFYVGSLDEGASYGFVVGWRGNDKVWRVWRHG